MPPPPIERFAKKPPASEPSFRLPHEQPLEDSRPSNQRMTSPRLSSTMEHSGHQRNDDDSFNHYAESIETDESTVAETKDTQLKKTLARTEGQAVRILRLAIWAGLAVTAIAFSVIVWWYVRREEERNLDREYDYLSEQLGELRIDVTIVKDVKRDANINSCCLQSLAFISTSSYNYKPPTFFRLP